MAAPCCATGNLHAGTPTGTTSTVHGLQCYIASPPDNAPPLGIIVIVSDAFGWTFNNSRILADTFAKRTGARVYMPDFLNGNVLSTGMFATMDAIMGKGWMVGKIFPVAQAISGFIPFMFLNRLSVTKPRIYNFFRALRIQEATSLPVAAAGYCWGGKHIFLLCSDSEKASNRKPLVDCGFTAHPSNLTIPADAEAVVLPLSVAVGDVDFVMPINQVNTTKEIFAKKGEMHEVVVYPGGKHGFAIRGDPQDEKAMEKGQQAEDQAVAWFQKWFKEASA